MPNLVDYNDKTQLDINLSAMSDEEFTLFASNPVMDTLYAKYSEAEKTAFLIRAMMLGEDAAGFKKEFLNKQNNMLKDGPSVIAKFAESPDKDKEDREFMYEVYRGILYSVDFDILNSATMITKYMPASQILGNHKKIKEVLTGHLNIPMEAEDDIENLKQPMLQTCKEERDKFVDEVKSGKYGTSLNPLQDVKVEEDGNDAEKTGKEEPDENNINENDIDEININEINPDENHEQDFLASTAFTVQGLKEDGAEEYDITIYPTDPNLEEDLYFAPFDRPETTDAEKRNILLSYIFRDMGEKAIRKNVKEIQKNAGMRDLLDRYVSVADAKKAIKDAPVLGGIVKGGDTRVPEAYALSQWVNSERKKQGKLTKEELDQMGKKIQPYDPFEGFHFDRDNEKAGEKNPDWDERFDIEKDYEKPNIFLQDVPYDEVRNADEWINHFKESNKNGTVSAVTCASRIFAARILADSVRGDGSSLKKPISGAEISRLANELENNSSFSDFLGDFTENEANRLIQKYGHGGVLEDKFKKYLLERKAGELDNSEVLQRFMPKVIDRIEELQRQARLRGAGETPSEEIAETMLLRAYVGAGRNNVEKLHSVIPANGDLKSDIEILCKKNDFLNAVGKEKVKNEFQSGHGGKMIVNMYRADANSVEKKAMNEFAVLCTAEYRYNNLKKKAAETAEKLEKKIKDNPKSEGTLKYCLKAKSIIAEAIAMESVIRSEKHKDPNISPTIKDIIKTSKQVLNSETFKKEMFKKRNPGEYLEEIKAFAGSESPKKYAEEKTDAITAAYRKAHPEAVKKTEVNKDEANKAEAKKPEAVKKGSESKIKQGF